jgi:hypothetical protein
LAVTDNTVESVAKLYWWRVKTAKKEKFQIYSPVSFCENIQGRVFNFVYTSPDMLSVKWMQ